MNKPKLLDLFCGAGGAAMGYHLAGFEVVGVDINLQPNYPFEFHQADAFSYLIEHHREFIVIHASPPCQRYSRMQHIHKNPEKHPDLIGTTRSMLKWTNKIYVIENVVGAPLQVQIMLCGTMFGLRIPKHRIFESNLGMSYLRDHKPVCNHSDVYDPYHGGEEARQERIKLGKIQEIDWFMTRQELREAIPPAYTKYIGSYIIDRL
jgi:DNA (cytosine-5)-methyltransferase 1